MKKISTPMTAEIFDGISVGNAACWIESIVQGQFLRFMVDD
jgi:hypothetical protein